MKKMKDLKVVLILLIVVLILVIVKSTGENRFKQDAAEAIELVKSNNFSVSLNEFNTNKTLYQVIDLNQTENPGQLHFENSLKIPFDKLLTEPELRNLKNGEKKALLYSDDNPIALKAWVILNQMDFKNVFVLSTKENPEVLKYEFQPDTTARLKSYAE